MDIAEKSSLAPHRLKRIVSVFHDIPPLGAQILDVFKFCSAYYHYPLGQVMINALPTRLRRSRPITRKTFGAFCLTETGRKLGPAALPAKAVVKRRLLERLKNGLLKKEELSRISPGAAKAINEFITLGWVREIAADSLRPSMSSAESPQLTAEQSAVVDSIQLTGFNCSLLFGITGSGKTEIYLNRIAQALAEKKQALLLVPEINLSPQLETRIKQRFPQSRIVSLHSGLNDGERLENWLAAQSGDAQIILGTRLAVFTPIPKLGLIIVDEEHDASYKQQDGLRYSARDIAIFRAKQAGTPVILGSATPALESYQHALSGRYRLAKLERRAVDNALQPDLHCIDIRRLKLKEGLSEPLIGAIRL
ncbi:MAG: DEAD/DEAH box helicase, partial [Burkholderiales bacterium]